MPGDSRTRIFYEDLDPQGIADYAERLAADGWEVAYVVYESATDLDASKEPAARGDYDLVTATRDGYRPKIDPPTMDIDVLSGATDPAAIRRTERVQLLHRTHLLRRCPGGAGAIVYTREVGPAT